jgi:hypothetical protein
MMMAMLRMVVPSSLAPDSGSLPCDRTTGQKARLLILGRTQTFSFYQRLIRILGGKN